MSIYEPLRNHLKNLRSTHWKASFSEIERILARPLPKSAYTYQAWWANQEGRGHSQTTAWRDAGWKTANLDLSGKTVEFERAGQPVSEKIIEKDQADEALLRRAGLYLGTTDRQLIYREGVKALVEREAAKRLARLGGSSPDLEIAPRRRGEG